MFIFFSKSVAAIYIDGMVNVLYIAKNRNKSISIAALTFVKLVYLKKNKTENARMNYTKQCVIHKFIWCQKLRRNATCSFFSLYVFLPIGSWLLSFSCSLSLRLPLCRPRPALFCGWCEFFIAILVWLFSCPYSFCPDSLPLLW